MPARCSADAAGCAGDGLTDDTVCLQAALRRCATVELPGNAANLSAPRVYLSGSLQLFSGTTLLVRAGAVLRSSSVLAAFPLVAALPSYNVTRYRHADPALVLKPHLRHRAFVWAEHASDVRLAGGGTIDGQRARWFKRSMLRGGRRRRGGGGGGAGGARRVRRLVRRAAQRVARRGVGGGGSDGRRVEDVEDDRERRVGSTGLLELAEQHLVGLTHRARRLGDA